MERGIRSGREGGELICAVYRRQDRKVRVVKSKEELTVVVCVGMLTRK